MSIIDPDDVVTGLIKSIRTQVGTLLSKLQTKDKALDLSAVIQDVQGGIRPEYPFIVVSLEESNKESGGWLRYVTVGSDDQTHILSEQSIPIRITCHGDKASNILTILRAKCLDEWARVEMNENSGATFVDYTDITRQPVYLETGFVKTASMTATFTAVSDMTSSAGTIDTVTGEGRYLHYEGDNQPIVEEFNISSQENNYGLPAYS